jgi:hypothetical protein
VSEYTLLSKYIPDPAVDVVFYTDAHPNTIKSLSVLIKTFDKKKVHLYTFHSHIAKSLGVNLHHIHTPFMQLDDHFYSIEIKNCYPQLFIHKDVYSLHHTANALLKFLNGSIPKLLTRGQNSDALASLLYKRSKELQAQGLDIDDQSEFDAIIVIERDVDLVSPLCIQFTFEGIIDELFGINTGIILLLTLDFINVPGVTKTSPLQLSSDIYNSLKLKHLSLIPALLNKSAKILQLRYEERHNASLEQLKHFVGKIPELKSQEQELQTLISVAEVIVKKCSGYIFRTWHDTQMRIAPIP